MNIRSGLNRHMTLPPWNTIINLMHDAEFKVVNQVLIGQFRKIKMDGNDKTQHKPAISAADMKKMYNSDALDVNNPVGLQLEFLNDLVKDCNNCIANALEILQSNTKPSIHPSELLHRHRCNYTFTSVPWTHHWIKWVNNAFEWHKSCLYQHKK